jgi:hypothetical protein
MTDRPELHLVPADDDGDPAASPDPDQVAEVDAAPDDAVLDDAEPEGRDPLLDRAERIAELPLAERPAAFDRINRAVVGELNQLDEG